MFLDTTHVPVEWHLNSSNGLSRINDCDRLQTTDRQTCRLHFYKQNHLLCKSQSIPPKTGVTIRFSARCAQDVSRQILLWTECEKPKIQPRDVCIEAGQTFTCAATNGHPGFPSYIFYYWTTGTNSLVSNGQSYQVAAVGNFSLVCEVKYSHQYCQQHSAACYANYTGTATYRECAS